MSVTADANILIYAINESSEEHDAARALVEGIGRGPEIAYLFWPVLIAFLRIATHPAILPRPITPEQAGDVVGMLLARPHVRAPGEEEGFWRLHTSDPIAARTRGNDVVDAHLVTLMRQHGVRRIYTRDRGFRRFDGIEVVDPIA